MVIKLVLHLLPLSCTDLFFFFRNDIVKIMFQRGNFNEEYKECHGILPYMLLGMTFMLSVRYLFVLFI